MGLLVELRLMGGAASDPAPLERHEHENGLVTYQSAGLRRLGVRHGFSTRIGGVSSGPYASLNLGYLTKGEAPDDNTNVAENFRRLRAALGLERVMRVQVRQSHGCAVWVPPGEPTRLADSPAADGMVSDDPRQMLVVRMADCPTVLLAGAGGGVVGAVHAGWRGLVAGVLGEAVRTFGERFGVGAEELTAAIGPCISVERYEVGAEVAEAFREAGLGTAVDEGMGEKPHVDLTRAAVLQLAGLGVAAGAIEACDRCTYRDEEEFFSYRRSAGGTGHMAAVITPRGRG